MHCPKETDRGFRQSKSSILGEDPGENDRRRLDSLSMIPYPDFKE